MLFVLKVVNHVTVRKPLGMQRNSLQLDDCPLKISVSKIARDRCTWRYDMSWSLLDVAYETRLTQVSTGSIPRTTAAGSGFSGGVCAHR